MLLRLTLPVLAFFAAFAAIAAEKFATPLEMLGRTPSNLQVERVELQSLPVAIVKAEGKLSQAPAELPKVVEALKTKLKEKKIEVTGPPFAQFNAADEENYSADIMLPVVSAPKEQTADLHFGQSPAGKALRVIHKGPLTSIEDTYFEIQTFIEDQGLEVQNTMIERYLTDLAVTPAKDMLTEVYLPLK